MTSRHIDAHQHFWKFSEADFGWIKNDQWILRRDFMPQDLLIELRKTHYEGCIAVQARQSLEETRWLLTLAQEHCFIKAVVGWVNLRSPNLKYELQEFCQSPYFKGVRHVVQDEPTRNFMLQPAFLRGIAQLASHQLIYEILVYAHQLPDAVKLAKQFPEQQFVLDHIGKPDIRNQKITDWKKSIEALASCQNVSVKVSGMVTEADHKTWKPSDFTSYLEVISEYFGFDRILLGSDWPVCLLAATYPQVMCLEEGFFEPVGEGVLDKIRGENAVRVYGL